MPTQATTPIPIVVVGCDVGCLAAAIFLARDGHTITVLERNSGSHLSRTTGGPTMFNNLTSILRQRGLCSRLVEVANISNTPVHRRHSTREGIARSRKLLQRVISLLLQLNRRQYIAIDFSLTVRHAMFHRADLLKVFSELVVERGVDVRFSSVIVSIKDSSNKPVVKLTELAADLLVTNFDRRIFEGSNCLYRVHIVIAF